MASKDELKVKFSTGKTPTGADFAELIEGVVGPQGPKGDAGATGTNGTDGAKGAKGDKGDSGTAGLGVKSIALTTDASGAVTGGTLTLTDSSTSAITVTIV